MTPAKILTTTELDMLGDANRELIDTAQLFTKPDEHTVYNVFDKALHIKQTLDFFEEVATTKPSWQVLAVLINGEHLLMHLYQGTPLRYNPFLSHWVEAVQRLDALGISRERVKLDKGISTEATIVARALWIKTLLAGNDHGTSMNGTPMTIANALIRNGLPTPFKLHPYIQTLEEEGIYEAQGDDHHDASINHIKGRENGPTSVQEWKATLPQKLRDEPDQAIFELTRLPIELSYLDYFTTLLNDHTLEHHSIDPAPVVTQYIQHALRTIERMEKPPSNPQNTPGDNEAEFLAGLEQDLEYGSEAQSRAVKLLLLFIKSLIRKGLVGADVLYFEIQEICIRYVWIREVREFRSWIEEGVSLEGAS